jgi:hypothetical protein
MSYRGVVRNGVVVLDRPAVIEDGAVVTVDRVQAPPEKGTPAAILAALEAAGPFPGDPDEWDRMLAEMKAEKMAEARDEFERESRNGDDDVSP